MLSLERKNKRMKTQKQRVNNKTAKVAMVQKQRQVVNKVRVRALDALTVLVAKAETGKVTEMLLVLGLEANLVC
jgi:ribosomal protein S8E